MEASTIAQVEEALRESERLNRALEERVAEHAAALAERDERLRALVGRLLKAEEGEWSRGWPLVVADRRGDAGGVLTRRELDVLRLLAVGKTNREIAQELHLSPSTVKGHVERIIAKLDVRGRTQAAVKAMGLGLMDAAATQKRVV